LATNQKIEFDIISLKGKDKKMVKVISKTKAKI
jgi:hypothetical protein